MSNKDRDSLLHHKRDRDSIKKIKSGEYVYRIINII